MKNNIKFHCILLIVAVVVGLILDGTTVWKDYVQGFIDGWNSVGYSVEEPIAGKGGPVSFLCTVIPMIVCSYTFISFWVVFVKLLFSLKDGNVFDESIVKRTRKMGYTLIVMFVGIAVFCLYTHEPFSGKTLVIGSFLLIFSEIFRIARVMKEEQDLTI